MTESRFDKTLGYVINSLIVIAVVSGVGSALRTSLNAAEIANLSQSLSLMQGSMGKVSETLHQTALINATQTEQLRFLQQLLEECHDDLKKMRNRRAASSAASATLADC